MVLGRKKNALAGALRAPSAKTSINAADCRISVLSDRILPCSPCGLHLALSANFSAIVADNSGTQ